MTELLQQAIAAIEKLPPEEQDAIAARILADLTDEQAWSEAFAATTDLQWDRLVAGARQEVEAGQTMDLDEVFPPETSQA